MNEKLGYENYSKSESEIRFEKLDVAVEAIKEQLSPEEMEKVKAIILYGSTARGEAKETSDLDIHIDLEP